MTIQTKYSRKTRKEEQKCCRLITSSKLQQNSAENIYWAKLSKSCWARLPEEEWAIKVYKLVKIKTGPHAKWTSGLIVLQIEDQFMQELSEPLQ